MDDDRQVSNGVFVPERSDIISIAAGLFLQLAERYYLICLVFLYASHEYEKKLGNQRKIRVYWQAQDC